MTTKKRVLILEENGWTWDELQNFFLQKGFDVLNITNNSIDALEVKNKPKNFIWFDHRTHSKKDRVNINDIVYAEIEAKDYIRIVTTTTDYRLKSSLENFSKETGLLRLRDNTAVNINYVSGIGLQDQEIHLTGSYGGKSILVFTYTFLSSIKSVLAF